ncbi:MAG TPA: CpsD/CapB family tyrosine-protein kinase [Bryobacteraceae bacterium]|jgi:capsular exopolysaccharide synthesis family protein
MSKIFQALHGTQNEVSDLLPELIGEGIEGNEPAPHLPAPGEEVDATLQPIVAPVAAVPAAAMYAPPKESAPAAPPAVAAAPGGARRTPLALQSSSPLLPFENPHAHAAEQYRILRTKLAHHPKRPKMIVVSSANPGDGKTFTAINLSGVLSLKGDAKVLLMDADFRRSAIHAQLGLPEGPGLSEVVLGACQFDDAVIQAEQFPNLHILVNGKLANMNPSELLDSPYWRALCQMTRKRYQYVIVDSPPVAAVADYELIQMAADGMVLVVRPEHTNRSACFKAIETIPRDKFLGVILNCAQPWFLHKAYGYEYNYGYGYASDAAAKR